MIEPLCEYPDGLEYIAYHFLCNHNNSSYYLSKVPNGSGPNFFVIDRVSDPYNHNDDHCIGIDKTPNPHNPDYILHKSGYDMALEFAKKFMVLM